MTGEIQSVRFLAPGVADLRVGAALREPAPGRFVHIAVPGFSLRRPISLCGYEDGTARLVLAVKGQGTAALANLKPGNRIDLMGALGNGFPGGGAPLRMSGSNGSELEMPSPLTGKTILVGGGVGLPPLLYYARTHEHTHAIAGCRTNGQVILIDEFPSADLCTDDGSAGLKCYPHQRLDELLLQGENAGQVLACGPLPLLKAVAGVCKKYGVPCFVSMEERMACGIGACLVCACAVGGRYLRCCKDGPVFNAADVDWGTAP